MYRKRSRTGLAYTAAMPTSYLARFAINADNVSRAREFYQKVFDWEPSTRLRDGLERTYRWIYDQMAPRFAKQPAAQAAR